MTMNVEVKEPVTTLDAQIHAPMHVVKGLNAEHVIMALFARVQEVLLEILLLPVVPTEIVEVVDLAVSVAPAMSLESLDIEDSSTITSLHFTRITQASKIVPYSQIKNHMSKNINLKTGKIRKRAIDHYSLIILLSSLYKNQFILIFFTM